MAMWIIRLSVWLHLLLGATRVQPKEKKECDPPGESRFLTQYLDKNETRIARRLSLVNKDYLEKFVPKSLAGYLTVDRKLGNHMFFWLFPSEKNAKAPLLLWLNGGPTVTSMLGLFHENGPLQLDTSSTSRNPKYFPRKHSWVGPFSMLYVDNPVGTGFSFSDSGEKGERNSEEDYTKDLFNFLIQFFSLYPEFKDNQFYIGGQSYAGMYVISLAHHIFQAEQEGMTDFALTGIYLGGPLFDPIKQLTETGNLMYHIGGMSLQDLYDHEKIMKDIFTNQSEISPYNSTISQIVSKVFGRKLQNNFFTQEFPPYKLLESLMNTKDMKKALHVGKNRQFKIANRKLRDSFSLDFMNSRVAKLAEVLDRYKVLIFNGNLDATVSTGMIEVSLLRTPWSQQSVYNKTSRYEWSGGYFSSVANFCRVIVSRAGHQTSADRPEETLEMMTMFVKNGCFKTII